MKYYTFRREENNFDDIINDTNLKGHIVTKLKFTNGLILGFKSNVDDKVLGYVVLKYGEDIKPIVAKDYTPIIGVDYKPQHISKFIR